MTTARSHHADGSLAKTPATRRDVLRRTAVGFGHLAAAAMLADRAIGADRAKIPGATAKDDLAPHPSHARPLAKRVIFLFMQGGVSHVDTFDPKPALDRWDGKPPPFERTRVQFAKRGNLMRSPWTFRPCGESGLPMSDLWQHLPSVADRLCMIHSVCETNVAHGGATMKLHCGDETLVRPSLGSWISYGLGNETDNLPSYVTICPSSLHGGVNNWGAAFLPSIHQGVPLGVPGYPNSFAKDARFPDMQSERSRAQQRLQLDLLADLSGPNAGAERALDGRLASFELAFRMQLAAPEALDVSQETRATRVLYGLDDDVTSDFGLQCLLARRFAERGVRFIQVNHSHSLRSIGIPTNEQWDQHSHLVKGHGANAAQVDKPIAGLITDLAQRGLLDDTLVVWAGEFGRTPTVQAGQNKETVGRDHHPDAFTVWLAGGGVKGGHRYGVTDEFGYYVERDRCSIYDLHATILHLLGLDHTRLTYRHAGRDFRLTDVYGNVAHDVIA